MKSSALAPKYTPRLLVCRTLFPFFFFFFFFYCKILFGFMSSGLRLSRRTVLLPVITNMADRKAPLSVASTPEATDVDALDSSTARITPQDAADMARLGKTQQFHRNFSYWSTFGFVSIYMATWELSIVSMTPAIPAVGFGGFFWTFLGCMVCYGAVVASLAEICSMSPTAGGQYHWVSEFAPPRFQKEMSYAAGWMSTLGWIASLAGGTYVCADLVQVAVNIVWADYVMTAWQLFLIILAMLLITIVLNTLGARSLPALEVASLVGHTAGLVVFVGVLWGMCRPLNSSREVFLGFENNSGWSNYGAACLVTQVSIIWSMLGSDTIVHICKSSELLCSRSCYWHPLTSVF